MTITPFNVAQPEYPNNKRMAFFVKPSFLLVVKILLSQISHAARNFFKIIIKSHVYLDFPWKRPPDQGRYNTVYDW